MATWHKKVSKDTVIVVKHENNTFTASLGYDKCIRIANAESAALAIAVRVLGVRADDVRLLRLPDERPGYYRYQVI